MKLYSYEERVKMYKADLGGIDPSVAYDFLLKHLNSNYVLAKSKSDLVKLSKQERIMWEFFLLFLGDMVKNFKEARFESSKTVTNIQYAWGLYKVLTYYWVEKSTKDRPMSVFLDLHYSGGMDELFWVLANVFGQKYALVSNMEMEAELYDDHIEMSIRAKADKAYDEIYFKNITKKFSRFAKEDLSKWMRTVWELYPEEKL